MARCYHSLGMISRYLPASARSIHHLREVYTLQPIRNVLLLKSNMMSHKCVSFDGGIIAKIHLSASLTFDTRNTPRGARGSVFGGCVVAVDWLFARRAKLFRLSRRMLDPTIRDFVHVAFVLHKAHHTPSHAFITTFHERQKSCHEYIEEHPFFPAFLKISSEFSILRAPLSLYDGKAFVW